MLDFASDNTAVMITWLAGGRLEEDDQAAALQSVSDLSAVEDPAAHAQGLRELTGDELVAVAHAYGGRWRVAQQLLGHLLDLLEQPAFRDRLDQLVLDPRLEGATMAEVIQWARVAHEGEPGAFERLIGYREQGRR